MQDTQPGVQRTSGQIWFSEVEKQWNRLKPIQFDSPDCQAHVASLESLKKAHGSLASQESKRAKRENMKNHSLPLLQMPGKYDQEVPTISTTFGIATCILPGEKQALEKCDAQFSSVLQMPQSPQCWAMNDARVRHHATLEERLDYLEKVMGDGHGCFLVFSTFPEIGETKDNAQSWILLNQYDNFNQKSDRRKLNPSHQPNEASLWGTGWLVRQTHSWAWSAKSCQGSQGKGEGQNVGAPLVFFQSTWSTCQILFVLIASYCVFQSTNFSCDWYSGN